MESVPPLADAAPSSGALCAPRTAGRAEAFLRAAKSERTWFFSRIHRPCNGGAACARAAIARSRAATVDNAAAPVAPPAAQDPPHACGEARARIETPAQGRAASDAPARRHGQA